MPLPAKIREKPVFRAIGKTGGVAAAIGTIFATVKGIFDFQYPPFSLIYHALYAVIILFLVLLLWEYRCFKKEGVFGKTFEYRDGGVLWHGSEKAIAFRTSTFLGLLKHVSANLPPEQINAIFLDSGRTSGQDFAGQFVSQIYPAEVQPSIEEGKPFSQLTRKQRLKLWSEYDSSTGWGVVTATEKPNGKIEISIEHPDLFRNGGGNCYAYFLAGYCETVVNGVTHDFGTRWGITGDVQKEKRDAVISFVLTTGH